MQFEQKVNAAAPMAVPIAVAAGGGAVAHAVPIAVAAPMGGGGDPDATRQFLASEGFPRGLAEQVLKTKETFPLRYWVVDNSGSMGINDGTKIKKRGQAPVQCTRWEELQVSDGWWCRSCLSPPCQLSMILGPCCAPSTQSLRVNLRRRVVMCPMWPCPPNVVMLMLMRCDRGCTLHGGRVLGGRRVCV